MPPSRNIRSRGSSPGPVKMACLPCRSSKTRCDGCKPCKSCRQRGRGCNYQASRRGGPRKGPRYEIFKANRLHFQEQSLGQQVDKPNIVSQLASDHCSDSNTLGPHDTGTLTTVGQSMTPLSRELQIPNHSFNSEFSVEHLYEPTWLNETRFDHSSATSHQSATATLRVYKSEADILNAYYVFIHPYLPLLPAPLGPVYEDQSVTIHVHADQSTSSIKELLPWWPLSPLSLALSSILALITLDEPSPGSTFWRRACSDIFANSALKSIDHDLESLRPVFTRGCSEQIRGRDNRTPFHKNVHSHLEAILALVTLSAFEYCRHGNIGKMRIRINLAVTTAIDMSLHDLGRGTQDVCEPQRRAWWMTMYMVYLSSILNHSQPIITIDDPRISTPYPELHVPVEPWPLVLKALKALYITTDKLKPIEAGSDVPLSSPTVEDWKMLDSYVDSIIIACDGPLFSDDQQQAEAAMAKGMWAIIRIFIHTARIKLHRIKALLNAPIFLQQYCGLASIHGDSLALHHSIAQTTSWASYIPFNEEGSLIKCLSSSLTVARAFGRFPSIPSMTTQDPLGETVKERAKHEDASSSLSFCPAIFPYFACCAMQSCYALLMVLYKLRAAQATDRLSTCYHLLYNPHPGTEVQDSERLEEEIRHAVQFLGSSLQSSLFEAVNGMGEEIDSAWRASRLH